MVKKITLFLVSGRVLVGFTFDSVHPILLIITELGPLCILQLPQLNGLVYDSGFQFLLGKPASCRNCFSLDIAA